MSIFSLVLFIACLFSKCIWHDFQQKKYTVRLMKQKIRTKGKTKKANKERGEEERSSKDDLILCWNKLRHVQSERALSPVRRVSGVQLGKWKSYKGWKQGPDLLLPLSWKVISPHIPAEIIQPMPSGHIWMCFRGDLNKSTLGTLNGTLKLKASRGMIVS